MNDFTKEDFQAMQTLTEASVQMSRVINRIRELEKGLENARYVIKTLKGYISPEVYVYGGKEKCVSVADSEITNISQRLGR